MLRKLKVLLLCALLSSLLGTVASHAQEPAAGAAAAPATTEPAPTQTTPLVTGEGGGDFKSLDQEVQSLKKEVLDLNRELFVLEEELLFPANTQVAVFVSMDVGEFFALDS